MEMETETKFVGLGNPLTTQGKLIRGIIGRTETPEANRVLLTLILLERLQKKLHSVCISETILDLLESLEAHLASKIYSVSDAMADAYCAVALECTLKYLLLRFDDNPSHYTEAVQRIWRKRIELMERSGTSRLYSDELNIWRKDIVASLTDSSLRRRLASVDTRSLAVNKLETCVVELLAYLGTGIVELVASNPINTRYHEAPIVDEASKLKGIEFDDWMNDTRAETSGVGGLGEMNEEEIKDAESDTKKEENNNNNNDDDDDATSQSRGKQCHVAEDDIDTLKFPSPSKKKDEAASITTKTRRLPERWTQLEEEIKDANADISKEKDSNNAASTSQRDAAEDDIGTRKFHLPSPRKRRYSPLKTDEEVPILPKIRRKSTRWTKLEEEALIAGTKKFGYGDWVGILNCYRDVFQRRTPVDLKDKWRNLSDRRKKS